MSSYRPSTLGYFCAPAGHLWEWSADDDHACIVWHGDGALIVYREELEGLLDACLRDGLPPLGALLLVVAAAQQNYSASNTRIRLWEAAERATGSRDVPLGIADLWKRVGIGLDQIHALPAELRASGPARWHLLQTLFGEIHCEVSRNVNPSHAREILWEFKQTPYIDIFQQRSPELNGVARLLADLSALEKAFEACPPEHLEQRLRTGLDQLPSRQLELPLPQPDETPTPEVPSDLLRALEQEGGELAQVAGLVRRMSAILHVPKAVTHRDEMPLGGVSDITNRGDPSRLLMTELAWDDLTFAVRLSQGEALYLRRESPPAEPPPRRLILIDTGIFMWGKPRLFALGAALALLRQKHGSQAVVGRVMACDATLFTPIPLETVEDIRAQLIRLQPTPHPGLALNQLLDAEDEPLQPDEEVFLITHPSACEQLTPQPFWQRLATTIQLHTLLVDRDGALQLARHSLAGAKTLSEARVDAEDLFEQPKTTPSDKHKPSPAALTSEAGRLPQFYRQMPWPLCHPGPPAKKKAFQMGGKGFVGLSTTGCVCWWTMRVHSGRILSPTAPTANFAGIVCDPEDYDRVLILFPNDDQSELHLLVASLEGQHATQTVHYRGKLVDLADMRIESGALILLDHGVYKALNLSTSHLIASTRPEQYKGRPWFDGEQFHAEHKNRTLPILKITSPAKDVGTTYKWQRISEVTGVGFGLTGGLFLQMAKGRHYELVIHDKERLSWVASENAAVIEPFRVLALNDADSRGLMQANFADGRRIVFDPCGFLHVCDSGEEPQELSITLVKGSTAAWQRKGFHYGDVSLLWTINLGASTVLESLTRTLFRKMEVSAQKTAFPAGRGLFETRK